MQKNSPILIQRSVDSMSSASRTSTDVVSEKSESRCHAASQEKSFEESLSKSDVFRIRTYFPARNDAGITLTNFVAILKTAVQDTEVTFDNALQLFNRCDANNEGLVSWIDLINHLAEQYMIKVQTTSTVFASFQIPPTMIRPQVHIRTHLDLIGMYELAEDHIFMISAHGSVIEWNLQLRNRDSAILSLPEPETITHRKFRILDFSYLPGLRKLILSSDSDEFIIYETVPVFNFICKIVNLTSIPLKLDCSIDQEGSYLLCYGDEEGCINCLHFPDFVGFIPSVRGVVDVEKQIFNFENLVATGVIEYNKWKVHSSPICQLQYIENINAVVSCSKDRYRSLVIGSVHGKKRVGKFHVKLSKHSTEYTSKSVVFLETASSSAVAITNGAFMRSKEDEIVFNVVRGVLTFDFSTKSKYFVTGGVDQFLRIWYVDNQSRAFQTQELMGHRRPFVFVKFHEASFSLIISMSLDKEIRIWNTGLFTLIFTLVPYEYVIDDRVLLKTAFFSSKTEKLYIISDYVYTMPLIKHGESKYANIHKATVNCLVYRSLTNVVITGDQNGVIKLWKLLTGRYLGECFCATEKSPVTFMMTDYLDMRLMSAHEDGFIRIWNLGSYQCIKLYRKSNEATITCMAYLNYNQFRWFVCAGWDRQLHFYSGFQNDGHRYQNSLFTIQDKAYYPYEGSFIMTGHILCMTEGPQNRMVIGCDDGEIHVWNVYERKMIKCLVVPPPPDYIADSICHAGLDLRIHKIYFLWTRLKNPDYHGAVLVSLGPYNRVHFWTYIIGDTKVYASFQPTCPKLKKTFSCCMELTPDDCLLCTGDGRGNIIAWDITTYAIEPEDSCPSIKWFWNAHDLPVTDLKIIDYNGGNCIVSVSVDCSVKLWTVSGTHIGTFGCDRWELNKIPLNTVQNVLEEKRLKGEILESESFITSRRPSGMSDVGDVTIEKVESSERFIKSTESLTSMDVDTAKCELYESICGDEPLEGKRRAVQYVKDHLHLGAFHAVELQGDVSQPIELPIHPLIDEMAIREFRRPFQSMSRNLLNSL